MDQIIKDYELEIPKESHTPDEQNGQTGPTGINAFRNSLLPDGAQSANFTTTMGADLKLVKGTIYAGTHPGHEQRILWIKLDTGKVIPTVYTLWRYPRLLPLLHTPNIVVSKMREGADLNTPGLARGPPFPPKAVKGAVVAVASYESPTVPLVVGICEIDVAALTEVQGQKGHAVRPIHSEGDEAWAWSPGGHGGQTAPAELEEMTAALSLHDNDEDGEEDEDDGGVSIGDANSQEQPAGLDPEPTEPGVNADKTRVVKEWSTTDIDNAFRNAFLFAIHHARTHDKTEPHHGIDFPISMSQFVANLISPNLPIFTPEDAAALQIKKTSWKNAKKFIKVLDKQMLLKSKDRNGGETVILDIDFNDQAITGFTPYRLPKKQAPGADSGTASSGAADTSSGQRLKRLTFFKPKASLSPIFADVDARGLYLPQDIKPIVTKYIEEEALVEAKNRRLIRLNPVLANAVFDSNSSIDREVLAKGTVPRDALIERVIQGCAPFWAILRNDESKDDVKPKAGQPPSIKIQLETRTGNKTATKVWGLEAFHIHAQGLAEELQKSCASSTSVGQQVGSSPKTPVMEIMVQGPQKDAILKALEKRGVRKDWVEVIDKTKGKKK